MAITMDELQKYYEYLRKAGADVPGSFDSFRSTLQDPNKAKAYYKYVRENNYDAPPTYESFANTLGISKSQSAEMYDNLMGRINGNAKVETAKTMVPASPITKSVEPAYIPDEDAIAKYNENFENITGHREFTLSEPVKPSTLLGQERYNKKKKEVEFKKFELYREQEKEILKVAGGVETGTTSAQELQDLRSKPHGKKVVEQMIGQYMPEVSASQFDSEVFRHDVKWNELAKRINATNRANGVALQDQELVALDTELPELAASYEAIDFKQGDAGGRDGGSENIPSTIPAIDFNDPSQYGDFIKTVKDADFIKPKSILPGQAGVTKDDLLGKAYKKLSHLVVSEPIPEEIEGLTPIIEESVLRQNIRRNSEVDEDKLSFDHFKKGLHFIKYSDPVLYKNVVRGLMKERVIADMDFKNIAAEGQRLVNLQKFRGAAIDPSLIDSETAFEYKTFQEKKAEIAGIIGERLKQAGYRNVREFSKETIKRAGADLDTDIVRTLAVEEQMIGYDAIPKTGGVEAVVRGISQPIAGISSTLQSAFESPAETYLRSKALDTGIGQLVPDDKGNLGLRLKSDRSRLWYTSLEGLGQFLPQLLLTRGIGGVMSSVANSAARTVPFGYLTASQSRNIMLYGGTGVSVFMQTFGDSYADALKKTGDPALSKLIGTIDGITTASWEMLLPDAKIADDVLKGLRKGFNKSIVDLIRKGGNPAELAAKGRPFIQRFVGKVLNNWTKETAEETGTNISDFITEAIFSPRTAKNRNLTNEVIDTTATAAVATFLPAFFGGIGVASQSDFTVNGLHAAAMNIEDVKNSLDKSLINNDITRDEYDKILSLLSAHKTNIENVPAQTSEGKDIPSAKQLEYAYQNTVIQFNKNQLELPAVQNDKLLEDKIKENIKDAEDIKKGIFTPDESTQPALPAPVEEKVSDTEEVAVQEDEATKDQIADYQQPFTTKSGKFSVSYEDGKRVIKNKKGKVIPEYITVKTKIKTGPQKGMVVSEHVVNPLHTRVLLQHAKSYKFNIGETSQNKKPPEFNSPMEANRWTIENSNNPSEIAATYLRLDRQPAPLSEKEAAIARSIGKVKQASFESLNDKNNITDGIAKTYFNKSGQSLDQVALSASNYGEGVQVTPEEVADFMVRFPYGIDPDAQVKTSEHSLAEEKFESLTGIPLASNNGKNTVANLAASQLASPEIQQQAEEAVNYPMPTDELARWLQEMVDINNEETEQFDNLTDNHDQETENATAETTSGRDSGTEGNTGQNPGGESGAGTRTDTPGDSSREDSAVNEPGTASSDSNNGNTSTESGTYTELDFERELNDILSEPEEDGPQLSADNIPSQQSTVENPVFARIKSAIEKMFSAVKNFKGITVLPGQDFESRLNKAFDSPMFRPDGTVYGFVKNGEIVLNGDYLNVNTPIHESAHIFNKWAKDNAPDLYNAGIRHAANSVYMGKVKSNRVYLDQAEAMRTNGKSEQQIEDFFADEALAMAVGDRGASILNTEKRSAFRQWLINFWNSIKQLFGAKRVEQMKAEQFSNLTFEQLTELVTERILSGNQLAAGDQAVDDSVNLMARPAGRSSKIMNIVQKALASGISETQIRLILGKAGYSPILVDNIIENVKRMPIFRPIQVPNPPGMVGAAPNNITFTPTEKGWYQRQKDSFKKWAGKYFSVNKGMPEWMLPLGERTTGVQNSEIQAGYRTVKQMKSAAKKIGFNDWDKVDTALRDLKQLAGTSTVLPAVIPQSLQALPDELKPIVIKMRAQIDGLTRDLITNGYVSPEQALNMENNMGEYMTRAYRAYNEKSWAKSIPQQVKDDAANFLYKHYYVTLKIASPTLPQLDLEAQAKEMALSRVQSIIDGIDSEFNPSKLKTVKGRDNGILKRRDDIPQEIRALLGEYTDPGQAFMLTIAKMATLRGQAEYLSDVRDLGMGNIFFEKDDPMRPQEASVELRSPGTDTWYPLGGLYTTPDIAEHFNETENIRNAAVQAWMSFIGAVRWGKTVGSVVTQVKNFESNLGFAMMNGHFKLGSSGTSWKYMWDQLKWWNGEKMDDAVLDAAAAQGLIGQNVGVRELKDMFNSDNTRRILLGASTAKNGAMRRLGRKPKQTIEYLNKVYSASDDFFKIYGFVNERAILSKGKYGTTYDQLTPEQQLEIDKEAAERVKNVYPTYDRVWEGAKYLSKNMPIFGNFLSFQAESVRVLLNSFQYAIQDMKNPQLRGVGARRLAGISAYLGTRYAILKAVSMMTGVGMSAFMGSGDSDEEQKLDDINRYALPFMRSGEKLVIPNGSGRYTVYDLTSLEPYGLWFKTMNAVRSGSEQAKEGDVLAAISEFLGPFTEGEMTFETMLQMRENDNGRGGRIYNPADPLGDKALDAANFAWDKLKPSTIGFVERIFERDNKANEIAAMFGGRGYDLDIMKGFSIKIYKAEEEIAAINNEFYEQMRKAESDEAKAKVAEKADKHMDQLLEELRKDYLAAIRLGVSEVELEERLQKADKKFIDVWSDQEIWQIWKGEGQSEKFKNRVLRGVK
jgi:hypothetical protein